MKGMKPFMQQGIIGRIIHIEIGETVDVAKIAVMSPKKKKRYSMAYGTIWSRMNELMNLDSDASQEQFNYIEDYRPSVRVFKDFISNITAHLGDIKTPARILYGEKDEQSYQDSAHYIYEHINSEDKDLTSHPLSKHLMTHGEGSDKVETQIAEFFMTN